MSILSKIKEEAAKQGHTIASLEKELGLGNGSIRRWDDNSPSCCKLVKVANFLNVSTDYLLNVGKEKALVFNESFTESEKKIILAYRNHPEMHEAVHKILGIEEGEKT